MKTLVLLSGGIDSTVVLWSCRSDCIALTINYGQPGGRHEEEAARDIAKLAGVHHRVIDAHSVYYELGEDGDVIAGRNLFLIGIAAGVAKARRCDSVAIGACRDDAERFPDCRPEFNAAVDQTLTSAYGIRLVTPLETMTKKDIVAMGRSVGAPLHLTRSCYAFTAKPCGVCTSCRQREAAL